MFSTKISLSIAFLFTLISGGAQVSVRDTTISILGLEFGAGYQSPGGDLADRFGSNANVSLGIKLKIPSNYVFGVQGGFLFGNDVKQNVALGLRTSDGNIIDINGEYVELLVLQRGMTLTLDAGYVFPLLGPNDNSGLMVLLGGGYLQHNIRLETRNNDVPALEGDYLKGYDRLSSGFTMHQLVGYQYYGNNRLVNFFIGVEGYQAFTRSRRDFNFDLKARDENKRKDSLYGVKFIWTFPLRRSGGRTFRYK